MRLQKLAIFLVCITLLNCGTSKTENSPDFVIAFGSCNKQTSENKLWKEVLKNQPNLWIWGGDNIYSDTEDMTKMAKDYEMQMNQSGYDSLRSQVEILGTWDDHDYGLNDGGTEFPQKAAAQGLFLDFMGVSKDDSRRNRAGIYHSKTFTIPKGTIKVIILDTRYHRNWINRIDGVYQKNETGTILGAAQWKWFETELKNSTADFNVIVSSIQVVASEHRFEKWANFPNEVIKFKETMKNSGAKGVVILSGDRHISEFSRVTIDGMSYPVIDFTSSGLTHSSTHFSGEPNKSRVGEVVFTKSFGLIQFDFDNRKLILQMKGENNMTLQEHIQTYP